MSFDQLISVASLVGGGQPKYLAIAQELELAIRAGQLVVGEKLPPQRQLAVHLRVTTGTISRAYAKLERLGLATARVGDGTYVRTPESTIGDAIDTMATDPYDLAHNVAIATHESSALQEALACLAGDQDTLRQVLRYQPETGMRRHRELGALWLRRFGTTGAWNRVMVTHGAQHGLACVLRTLARPGDTVLTETLSYPGLLALARSMRLQLIGIETDDEGMVPTALERAAKTFDSKLVYCSPTLHNPTSSTMSMARREAIAGIARRRNLMVIEDCVHAAAQSSPLPALSTWLPDQSFLLSSFSKVLAPGLRLGFLEAAPEWLGKFAANIRADSWMVAPLLPEIATRWIEKGTIEQLISAQRQAIVRRLEVAQRLLAGLEFRSNPEYPLIWLSLPEPWRTGQFSAALRSAGVLVRTADHFAVGRSPVPPAIRISLNASPSIEQLERGLQVFLSVLHSPPTATMNA